MTYDSTHSPRSFFPKLICFILLFALSGLWALSSDYPEIRASSPEDYYTDQFVPSLSRGPFARSRSETASSHAYQYAFDSHYSGEMLSSQAPQEYLSFIAQDPVYPLHVALLDSHSESFFVDNEDSKHVCARLGTFSKEAKFYRFSSGCNLPVFLGASNVLFSEPLGSTFIGTTFDHVPIIATPEPSTWLIYLTLGVLTVCMLRRRTS